MNNPQQLEGTKLNGFEPLNVVTELKSIDIKVGDGAEVPKGATITAHYTGALAKDGTIFQSSHDFGNPATFGLHQVIAGWTEGVPGMKVGGMRRLIIPAAQLRPCLRHRAYCYKSLNEKTRQHHLNAGGF
jgi:FKBP-type peptidyl-prolyl cis-trans isomerase